MKDKYNHYLQVFEKIINEIYRGETEDAQLLLIILGDLLISILPRIYLRHKYRSYEDFEFVLKSFLTDIEHKAKEEYKRLVMDEKY